MAKLVVDPEVARLLRITFCVQQPREQETPKRHIWSRADVAGHARPTCWACHGRGWALKTPGVPCQCVTRSIFRAMMAEWHKNQEFGHVGRYKPEQIGQRGGKTIRRGGWSLLKSEFAADLELLAKRVLDAKHLAIWRIHHCQLLPWTVGVAETGLDKGQYWHAVYRIEHALGRAARETRPYALYPIDEYYYR